MNSIKLRMTDQTPSTFGMPISGHAFGMTTGRAVRATDGCAATTFVVREREVILAAPKGATEGHLRLVQSDFPGTSAWRPPIC